MKTINYKMADGKKIELEVSEEFYEGYKETITEFKRNDERAKWHSRTNVISLENLIESGFQIEDKTNDFEIEDETYKKLYFAMKTLNNKQIWLLKEAFLHKKSYCCIARELGLTETAIRHRLATILKKLKKLL